MSDWEHITIHRADNYWSVLGRPDVEGSAEVDQLLDGLISQGWERVEDPHTLTGSDLTRVELRRQVPVD